MGLLLDFKNRRESKEKRNERKEEREGGRDRGEKKLVKRKAVENHVELLFPQTVQVKMVCLLILLFYFDFLTCNNYF